MDNLGKINWETIGIIIGICAIIFTVIMIIMAVLK